MGPSFSMKMDEEAPLGPSQELNINSHKEVFQIQHQVNIKQVYHHLKTKIMRTCSEFWLILVILIMTLDIQ